MLDRRPTPATVPRIRALAWLGAALVTTWGSLAHAGPFDIADGSWQGCSELLDMAREAIGSERVVPIADLDWTVMRPGDGLLLLHPATAPSAKSLSAFLQAGGRVAIVDDFGAGAEILSRWGIERTLAPTHPAEMLRHNAAFPIAEPATGDSGSSGIGIHPAVAGVRKLVTNHPTGLAHPKLPAVLRIRGDGEPDTVIAYAGLVEQGRLFAMSDPSALINTMLRYPGNRSFAASLARYLADDDASAKRSNRRLYILANRFDERGTFGEATSLKDEIVERLTALGPALTAARTNGLPTYGHLALCALAMAGAAAWVLRDAYRRYVPASPRYASASPAAAQGGVFGRFSVLAAASTPRALLLLELKRALVEFIATRFELSSPPATRETIAIVRDSSVLDPAEMTALEATLALVDRAESELVRGTTLPVSQRALSEADRVVHRTIAALNSGSKPQLGPTRTAPST